MKLIRKKYSDKSIEQQLKESKERGTALTWGQLAEDLRQSFGDPTITVQSMREAAKHLDNSEQVTFSKRRSWNSDDTDKS